MIIQRGAAYTPMEHLLTSISKAMLFDAMLDAGISTSLAYFLARARYWRRHTHITSRRCFYFERRA